MTLALLITRLLGLVRDVAVATRFGASEQSDVILLVTDLPAHLASLLGMSGVGAALMVAYSAQPERRADIMAHAMIGMAAIFGIVTLSLALAAPQLVAVLGPGLGAASALAAADALAIAFLTILLTAMTWPAVAFENVHGRFAAPAAAGALVNLTIVGAVLAAPFAAAPLWVGFAAALGAFARWLFTAFNGLRALTSSVFRLPLSIDRSLWGAVAAASAAEAGPVIYPLALRSLASLYGPGALAQAAYAIKLIFLPTFLVFGALAQVAFSRFVASKGDDAEQLRIARASRFLAALMALLIVATPASALFAADAVSLLFGWGALDASEQSEIALLTAVFALALPPMSLNMFLRPLLGAEVGFRKAMVAEIGGLAVFAVIAAGCVYANAPLWSLMAAAAIGHWIAMFSMVRALSAAQPSLLAGVAIGDLLTVGATSALFLGVGAVAFTADQQLGHALRLGLGVAAGFAALATTYRLRPGFRDALRALADRG